MNGPDVTDIIGYADASLKELGGYDTAVEIHQQPDKWLEAFELASTQREAVTELLDRVLGEGPLRVVFAGAGSSAFVGDALAPYLGKKSRHRFYSIATTDTVAAPAQYIQNQPTLLVSFARSGDSPESVATYDLYENQVDRCAHLVVTCNPNGQLAERATASSNAYCALMPSGTNDRGFAMTSSFTSMYTYAASLFAPDEAQTRIAARISREFINSGVGQLKAVANQDWQRFIVLGAGGLSGIAHECALKCLELAAGSVTTMHDTPLGFRHGPKSIVDGSTLILLLKSGDEHTALYDSDLLNELQADRNSHAIIDLEAIVLAELKSDERLDDGWRALCYLVYAQILSFQKSIALGVGPDNPCPSGSVNRVVQGVVIHPYGSRSSNSSGS